jgi:hypothetical protein
LKKHDVKGNRKRSSDRVFEDKVCTLVEQKLALAETGAKPHHFEQMHCWHFNREFTFFVEKAVLFTGAPFPFKCLFHGTLSPCKQSYFA